MNFGLRVLPSADRDVDEAAAFTARRSVDRAMKFYDAVEATYKMILEEPKRWALYGFSAPRLKDLRKRSVLGIPSYLVFYRIDADVVEIVRVLHGARNLPDHLCRDGRPVIFVSLRELTDPLVES